MARAKREKRSDRLADLRDISLGGEELSVSVGMALGREERSGGTEEEPPAPREANAPGESNAAAYLRSLQKAALHRESSGRGGRTVTVVSCRPAPSAKLAEELARSMRKGLGCGSHVEGEKIVLQGDIQERAEAWLTKRGVRVVMGN